MENEIAWPAWLIAGLLTLVFFPLTWRAGRRLRSLADTPTSKARGVFVGQVELGGEARLDPPLRSYLAEGACAWFEFTVDESWGRWETEHYTDSKGRSQTRRVYKTGWKTVRSGGEHPAFDVVDETGSVRVLPEGASVEPLTVFDETVSRGDALYYAKGPEGAIADSTHKRRFSERAIPLGAKLFVTGRARERTDVVAPEIAVDPEQEHFIITCREERHLVSRYRWQFWIFSVLILPWLPGATIVQRQMTNAGPIEVGPPLVVAAAMFAGWLLGWVWTAYNSLVKLRHRTAQAWSLVDVQLKRRADLIPRLVDVVAGLRAHEQDVQAALAMLRHQIVATPPGVAGPDLAGTSPVLVSLAERYPELKADAAFGRLQHELADTETRVALARDYFNTIATHLNTRLEIVPDRWVAVLAGLKPRQLLVAEGFERESVTVKLD